MRIISVVGNKDSGKTSLTIKIIKELKKRGFKVDSIKHSHHTMVMDKEDTDTYRHKDAGAEVVVGIGASTFFNISEQLPLDRILFLIKTIDEPDFVVIEGFKGYNYPKIATTPDVIDEFTIESVDAKKLNDEELILLVDKIEKYGYDIIDTLFVDDCGYNDATSIAKAFINGDLQYDPEKQADVSVSIDGINIGINAFVNDFINNTVLGMLKSLKTSEYGVNDFDKIEILINNKKRD